MTLETKETTKRERNSNSHEVVLDSSAKRQCGSSAFTVGGAVGNDFSGAKIEETAVAQNMEWQLLVAGLALVVVDVLRHGG